MKKVFRSNKVLAMILILIFILAACGRTTVNEDNYSDGASDRNDVSNDSSNDSSSDSSSDVTSDIYIDANSDSSIVMNSDANEDTTQYPYTFTDKFGNEIVFEAKPETYVSFAPEITETLFALGVGENMVGRSSYCDYPAEVASVLDLGSLFEFSLEKVIEVSPDVVFLSSMASEDVYQQLVDNNISVVAVDFDDNLEGTKTQIGLIGAVVGRIDEAKEINDNIQNAIDDLTKKAKTREPKSVYFAVSVGEFTSAATADTFINDIIVTTGAENAAGDGTNWMYTVEQLVEKDPYIVLCSNKFDTKATIESLDGYKDLTAVKEGHLYEIDENIFYRQGPRVVDALYAIDTIVYGEN